MATTIGHSQRARPWREMTHPPSSPPTVSAATPTVPYTRPTCAVLSARPPRSAGSSRKGVTSLTSCASPRRNSSRKASTLAMSGRRKNDAKVSAKPCHSPRAAMGAGPSAAGRGSSAWCHSASPANTTASTPNTICHAATTCPVASARRPAAYTSPPWPLIIATR